MRGSPLIRFIFLAIALVATGAGLARITATRENLVAPAPKGAAENPVTAADPIPFRLLLSAAASEVEIDTGLRVIRPTANAAAISGLLEMDPKNPQVGMLVRWQNPAAAGEHRFAKLTLESPGKPTFTHVFDARGDIDEILELPMPALK